MSNNYRKVLDGEVFIKVIGFPVPKGHVVDGEAMWVTQIYGDDNEGIGVLNSTPAFCTEVKLGDLIQYGGGSNHLKPRYLGKAKSDE